MTTISVICVCPSEAKAAHESAQLMSLLGVKLLVFSRQHQLDLWVAGARSIPGLCVKRLEASEFLSLRQSLESDRQAAQ